MIAASSINCVGFNLPFSTTRINIGDLMEARVGIEPEIVTYLLNLRHLETDEIG